MVTLIQNIFWGNNFNEAKVVGNPVTFPNISFTERIGTIGDSVCGIGSIEFQCVSLGWF